MKEFKDIIKKTSINEIEKTLASEVFRVKTGHIRRAIQDTKNLTSNNPKMAKKLVKLKNMLDKVTALMDTIH